MKLPKYLVTIGAQTFVVPTKQGLGAVAEFMADAVPVSDHTHRKPPEIELSYADRPDLIKYFQRVTCEQIPPNVIWTQTTKDGKVEIVRPVEKAPRLKAPSRKALPGPAVKALPARSIKALPPRDRQQPLQLGW